jgi:hypothetical protein
MALKPNYGRDRGERARPAHVFGARRKSERRTRRLRYAKPNAPKPSCRPVKPPLRKSKADELRQDSRRPLTKNVGSQFLSLEVAEGVRSEPRYALTRNFGAARFRARQGGSNETRSLTSWADVSLQRSDMVISAISFLPGAAGHRGKRWSNCYPIDYPN